MFSWNSGSIKVASARDLVSRAISNDNKKTGDADADYDDEPHLWVGDEEGEHGGDVGHEALEEGEG